MSIAVYALIALVAFALGSIPSGVIIGKSVYGVDIRQTGSGNIGTTNAIRALGKKGGYIVFAMDFGKGVIAGLAALAIASTALVPNGQGAAVSVALAFLCCILGHVFSPWLGFKGGKGIAVAVGCLFATFGPVGAIIELALFAIIVATTKYVSAGSVAAAVLCPFLALFFFWGDWIAIFLCTAAALVVIWAHRENIVRLMNKTERRIGEK